MSIQINFWGVRGSIPTPALSNLGVGGNTACVEIVADGESLIFDAGTGIKDFADSLRVSPSMRNQFFRLFLSHFHWDHIQGLPFFAPLFSRTAQLAIYSAIPSQQAHARLRNLMKCPNFPIEWDDTSALKQYIKATPQMPIQVRAGVVESFPLNHPQGAAGYRLKTADSAIVYASDLEHGDPKADSVLREYARNADVLIYDAQYTPEEYESGRQGWGHSTWLRATQLANECQVAKLVLFHHDPEHDDVRMAAILEQARREFTDTFVGTEGCSIHLETDRSTDLPISSTMHRAWA